jgi:Tfp pilus assembly protein PilN
MAAAVAVLGVVAGSAWLFLGVVGVAEELEVQIELAEADSSRYAGILQRTAVLQARRDTIAQRVGVLQQIDGDRYRWAHLMDEVGRALPDFTWLTGLTEVTAGDEVQFQIDGQSATYFGLTALMENLEASPFIEGVILIASEQISVPTGPGSTQFVYSFTLEAFSREPPPEVIEIVPLFGPSVVPPTAAGD